MNRAQDQRGVTLIELLIAVSLFGIISVAVVQLYQAAMMNWTRSMSQAQLAENVMRLFQYLNVDVHEAGSFLQMKENVLVLARGDEHVRYSMQNTNDGLQIVRDVKKGNSPWRREPGFPVADFQTGRQGDAPVVLWQMRSARQIDVEITQPGFRFQTSITKRSAL